MFIKFVDVVVDKIFKLLVKYKQRRKLEEKKYADPYIYP